MIIKDFKCLALLWYDKIKHLHNEEKAIRLEHIKEEAHGTYRSTNQHYYECRKNFHMFYIFIIHRNNIIPDKS